MDHLVNTTLLGLVSEIGGLYRQAEEKGQIKPQSKDEILEGMELHLCDLFRDSTRINEQLMMGHLFLGICVYMSKIQNSNLLLSINQSINWLDFKSAEKSFEDKTDA